MFWILLSTIVFGLIAITMLIIRSEASKRPITAKKIILPPIFMSTGSLMFIFPMFQVHLAQVIESVAVGIICSIFLIWTTNFSIRGQDIYVKPSKTFLYIISGFLVIRIGAKLLIGQAIAFGELSGMFYLLALGMIGTWRVSMFITFKKLQKFIR